jgi:hypothetical protein
MFHGNPENVIIEKLHIHPAILIVGAAVGGHNSRWSNIFSSPLTNQVLHRCSFNFGISDYRANQCTI